MLKRFYVRKTHPKVLYVTLEFPLKRNQFGRQKFMADDKKGKAEEAAEKTGQVIGKVGKKGWGVVKGFGKGVKEGFESDKKKKK
jgi:hypothetical protein